MNGKNMRAKSVSVMMIGVSWTWLWPAAAHAENPHPKPNPPLARKLLPLEHSLQSHLQLVGPGVPAASAPRWVLLPPLADTRQTPAAPGGMLLSFPRLAPARTPSSPGGVRLPVSLNASQLMWAMRAALQLPPASATASPRPLPRLQPARATRGFSRPAPIAVIQSPISLQVATHHSLLVQSPEALTRVSIADNNIAQAIVVSPNQVLIQGKAPGEVSLLLWDAQQRVRAYTVRVGTDPAPLQRELDHLFPANAPRVSASGNAVVLSGVMANAASAKRALEVAAGFSDKVVNNLSVDSTADPEQVLLQVRFAEVDRSAVTQLGANLISNGKGMVGSVGTQQFGAPTGVVAPRSNIYPPGSSTLSGNGGTIGLSNLLNVFLFSPSANLGVTLQALEQKNLLQILAEPNLLAMDGKEASFLAGGEFPFPVVQGQGSVNNVTIQFKPFGVNLHFTPNILPDGTIDLKVAPEVSSLDFSNALTVSGFLIPALSTRKAETELELGDGQSFVIAGLMDNRLTDNASKIPWLGDIPILGKFFQSKTTNRSRDELMVVVTAHLVKATATAPPGPRMPKPFMNPAHFDGRGKHL